MQLCCVKNLMMSQNLMNNETKKQKTFFDEIGIDDNSRKSVDHRFKVNTYFVIRDSFIHVLKNRFEDFSNTVKQFEFLDLNKFFSGKKTNEQSIDALKNLSKIYEIDIDENDLISEYK